ncbi:hypothetical protein Tco_0013591 [Tanacetum coccineum]
MTEAKGDGGEGLYVRGRSGQRDIKQGGSYHITYRRDYFVDFEEYEGGKILLGDGRECVCFRIKTKIDIAGQFLNKEGFSGRCSQSIKVIKVSLVGRTLKGRKQLGEFMGGRSRTVWSVQGTGSVQVLQGVEFKVEPREDHTFEVEPHGNVDHVAGSQEVQTQDLIYYHLARDREQHSTHELFSYREDIACDVIPSGRLWMKDVMDARSDVYAEIWATKGLLDKAKGNVLGMEIVRDQSEGSLIKGGCDVKKNGKWSCIYAVGSQEYQMVCTRLDIASADVGMLDSCDCWDYKTNVQVFVDFDYVMGRSINVMLGVDQSQAGYMTLTEAAKEAIWLKGLAIESGFELKISFKKGGGMGKTIYEAYNQGFNNAYHKEKMMMCKQAEQGIPLQAEQADWLEDTDEEIDEQELEAHYSYMAKIQEVSPAESSSTDTPLEQVQNHDENDVFANVRRHSEQPESINDTYVLEKDDSNVIPDSSNIWEATSSRDSSLIALQTKQTELEKYTALNDLTSDYKNTQTKLNDTLGLLAIKNIDISVHREKQPDLQENASNVFRKEREQYHEIQDLKAQMQDKNMVINELKKLILDNSSTSVSRPQLKSYPVKDKVVPNISPVKFTKKENVQHILFIVDLDARKHMTGNAQAFV